MTTSRSAELEASDGIFNTGNYFGYFSGLSGSIGIVGAAGNGTNGTAYIFRNLNTATGVVTQNLKLDASDITSNDYAGWGVSISGSTALVNAPTHAGKGAAYIFRGVDTATGSLSQSVKLLASDGASGDSFGNSGGLSGNTAILGANFARVNGVQTGAAYVFRGLDTATGTINESLKLTASDGAAADHFGISSAISGSIGVVGAMLANIGSTADQGAAYVFRNLDTATGTITESVKLVASDGVGGSGYDAFANYVAISGSTALVSAHQDDDKGNNSGSVYVFRNLDSATGTVNQNLKLVASDGGSNDNFGMSVGISGNVALVGAINDDDKASNAGAAYLYLNVNTGSGSMTEDVKIIASNGGSQDLFGRSLGIDGDNFMVSTERGDGVYANTGNAYSGSVSALTTLDVGNASRTIDGISFTSRGDWTIGRTTENNKVTLTTGDTANITAAGKAVYIGREAGGNNNTLVIEGTLNASTIYVGAQGVTEGNILQMESTASLNLPSIMLADENALALDGDYSAPSALLTLLGGKLNVWDEGSWVAIDSSNVGALIESTYDSGTGYTTVRSSVVPEPSGVLLLSGGLGTLLVRRRRSR